MLLVIDHRNTHVSCDRKTLLISKNNTAPQRVPIQLLENIIVTGNPTIESNVWRALAQAGISATLLPGRGDAPLAILGNSLSVTLPLRRLQYRCAEQTKTAIKVARWITTSKLRSYDLPLHYLQPATEKRAQFCHQQQKAIQRLTQTDTIEGLMGIEGSTASAWFKLMTASLPEKWRFTGRNRRPPRDPINALLSLGYTLLMSEVRQVLISEGLDPALGFLHQPFPAREALTLDITELYRAGVDCFLLNLLDDLRPVDFNYHKKSGCRLNKTARPVFYNAWANHRENWPRPGKNVSEAEQSPLTEQIRGQLMELRRVINTALENATP